MKDHLSVQERSAHMRRILGRNTQPELRVRRLLHAMGYRFRLHRRDLPGTPDIVLPKHRVAIFVHGCFWHQHEGCRLARLPKSRHGYWLPKFERNTRRDKEAAKQLRTQGWRPLVVWECETEHAEALKTKLTSLLP